ncbi:MAG: glycosyltransferase family 4 protein [Nocardioides sp.]|uniref:glycosyltransferase family 4 protein n=1 Tax=Nocardioides sp. TaxID=35761 RepID=UPI0039E3B3FF
MNFVVAQASKMANTDRQLFAIAAQDPELAGIPVTQSFRHLRLPYGLRRRTYPVADRTVGASLAAWRPDVINLHFLALGGFAARAARHARVPLVTTVHALEPFLMTTPTTPRERYLARDAWSAFHSTHLMLAVSNYIASWLVDLGFDASRVHTCYLGVDTEFWSPNTPSLTRARARRLLFVGHLTELKGIRDAVAASTQLQADLPHTLEVVGDGPLREEMEEIAARSPHVKLLGLQSREDVRQALGRSTALVLPTQPRDGIEDAAPTVLAEAQSMGVPVIAYDVGGTREMVAPSQQLVPVHDRSALAKKIAETLNMDRDQYASLASSSREWIRANRDLGACAARARDLMAGLI